MALACSHPPFMGTSHPFFPPWMLLTPVWPPQVLHTLLRGPQFKLSPGFLGHHLRATYLSFLRELQLAQNSFAWGYWQIHIQLAIGSGRKLRPVLLPTSTALKAHAGSLSAWSSGLGPLVTSQTADRWFRLQLWASGTPLFSSLPTKHTLEFPITALVASLFTFSWKHPGPGIQLGTDNLN